MASLPASIGSEPSIGVVIPVYNAERFVGIAIESVLAQTLQAERIVVIDDGSRDRSADVAARFGERVTCIRQANRGVGATRNYGAREAGTEWLAFLDNDDVWHPRKLEAQFGCAVQEGRDVVLCGVTVVDEQLRPFDDGSIAGDAATDVASLLFHREGVPQATPSTLFVRRTLFEDIGGYDEALGLAADWDLLLRLRMRAEFGYVRDSLTMYRRHGANWSRRVGPLERESVLLLERFFGRSDIPDSIRSLRRRCLAWNDVVLAGSYWWAGNALRAARLGVRGVFRDPVLTGRLVGYPVRHLGRWWRGRPNPQGHEDRRGIPTRG